MTNSNEIQLLVIDKDGTLTRPASGETFPQNPEDQVPIEGTQQAIKAYADQGWKIVIASNQGGCSARNPETNQPYKTVDEAAAEMAYCLKLFPEIEMAFFCPDFEGKECWRVRLKQPEFVGDKDYEQIRAITWQVEEGVGWVPDTIYGLISPSDVVGLCRKPDPGMLRMAEAEFITATKDENLRPNRVLVVGDRTEDKGMAEAGGREFLWPAEFLASV